MMISCISESPISLSETLRTLHFSMSAARIKNRPIRFLDPQQKLILELRNEIRKLKEENNMLRGTLTDSRQNTSQQVSQYQQLSFREQQQQQVQYQQYQHQQNSFRSLSEDDNQPKYSSIPNSASHPPINKQMNQNLPHISSQPAIIHHKSSSSNSSSSSMIRSKVNIEVFHPHHHFLIMIIIIES